MYCASRIPGCALGSAKLPVLRSYAREISRALCRSLLFNFAVDKVVPVFLVERTCEGLLASLVVLYSALSFPPNLLCVPVGATTVECSLLSNGSLFYYSFRFKQFEVLYEGNEELLKSGNNPI